MVINFDKACGKPFSIVKVNQPVTLSPNQSVYDL